MTEKNDFFIQVYEVTKLIPKGKVTSYGAIAEYLRSKKASRTVGYAMNSSHNDPDVPAHRVVNRNGLLTGKTHFSYPTEMQELLESEGHRIIDDQIQNFEEVYWEPIKELL